MTIHHPVGSVAEVFRSFPEPARERLLALRHLIFDTAAGIDGVGELTETLKWGEPAYLTEQSRSGSTIRLGWRADRPDECGLFFICRTSLVSDFRAVYDDVLRFEGNRAIILPLDVPIPIGPLEACIAAALTYHRVPHSSG